MTKVEQALQILELLDLPRAQQNDRTALSLLAILDVTPERSWNEARSRMIGITPIMNYIAEHYKIIYKPNSREGIRDNSVQQMVNAGMLVANPDDPYRSKNSSKNVYQVEESTLELLQTFGTDQWTLALSTYLESRTSLAARYARERAMVQVPITYQTGKELRLSPGDHSLLIKAIIEEFGSRYVPGGQLVYVGDTGNKWDAYFDEELYNRLGLQTDPHGKMPDVILYDGARNWLLLIESVTSNGPMDGRRYEELTQLFKTSTAPVVFVTAFPSRKAMAGYLPIIAWETEVWCADAPTHVIHFNGSRFLGPYQSDEQKNE